MHRLHARPLAVVCLAIAAGLGCSDSPDRTPEQQAAHDFVELASTLMEPLDVSTECPKIGAALDAWDQQNGARFRELAGRFQKLEGATARNYQRVKRRFDQVAMYCVRPKVTGGLRVPQMTHDAHVERVYQMLPATTLKFEMK